MSSSLPLSRLATQRPATSQGNLDRAKVSSMPLFTRCLLCFFLCGLGACGPKTNAPPPADPKVDPIRELNFATVVNFESSSGLITMARPTLGQATVGDPLSLLLHWEIESGWITKKHPLGVLFYDPRALAKSLVVHIESPEGRTSSHSLAAFYATDPTTLEFVYTFSLALRSVEKNESATAALSSGKTPIARDWANSDPPVLDAIGTYFVTVEGQLPFDDGAERFSVGPVPLRVVEPSAEFLDNQAIRERAKSILVKHTGSDDPFDLSQPTVDLPNGNRLVRLGRSDQGGFGAWTAREVELTPTGEQVGDIGLNSGRTCVAEDTLVETDRGSRRVQDLAVGDQVWAFDTALRKKLLTPVRAIFSKTVSSVLVINDNLRVTPEHPIYVDGSWLAAGDIRGGEELLSFELDKVRSSLPRPLSTQTMVYDLSVGWPNNFFAGGWLVHNKQGYYAPMRGDQWYWLFTRFEKLGEG